MKPTNLVDRILWPLVKRRALYGALLWAAVSIGIVSSVMSALGMVAFGWVGATIAAAFAAEAIQHSRWRYVDAVETKRRDIVEQVLGSEAVTLRRPS